MAVLLLSLINRVWQSFPLGHTSTSWFYMLNCLTLFTVLNGSKHFWPPHSVFVQRHSLVVWLFLFCTCQKPDSFYIKLDTVILFELCITTLLQCIYSSVLFSLDSGWFERPHEAARWLILGDRVPWQVFTCILFLTIQ